MKKPIKSTQPKEIPILFSTDMVKAIMADRKTETRRSRGLYNINLPVWIGSYTPPEKLTYNTEVRSGKRTLGAWFSSITFPGTGRFINCPYGQPGDILWVRETWADASLGKPLSPATVSFKADYSIETINLPENKGIWKPSIHMPKAAARIWLGVKDLSLQRVQELTVDQIKAEGVRIPIDKGGVVFNISDDHSAFNYLSADYWVSTTTPEERTALLYRAFWAELWVSINGPASWHQNPWVWVVKFKVLSTTGRPQNTIAP